MSKLAVIEVWGVASALTKRLYALGIRSVLDLRNADPVMILDRFSVVLMRTVLEHPLTAFHRANCRSGAAGDSESLGEQPLK